MEPGGIYEFLTMTGVSYIGKFIEENDDENFLFEDVLTISMRPVKTPDGQITMAPAMELIGVFTTGTTFCIPMDDIYQLGKVHFSNFIDMYKANVKMYSDAKAEHGSNIEVVSQIPDVSVQRKG